MTAFVKPPKEVIQRMHGALTKSGIDISKLTSITDTGPSTPAATNRVFHFWQGDRRMATIVAEWDRFGKTTSLLIETWQEREEGHGDEETN